MEIIQCERDKTAKITTTTCVARQKILATENRRNGWSAHQYRDCENTCAGCKTGLELYQKYLKGELLMDAQTKECPCGATITRRQGQNAVSWNRTKYCPKHMVPAPYQRKKLFDSLKTTTSLVTTPEKAEVIEVDIETTPEETPAVKIQEPTPKDDPEFLPEKKDPAPAPKVKTRKCLGCGETLDLTVENFHKDSSRSEGFRDRCKACRKTKSGKLIIDLSDVPEALERFTEYAKGDDRTPEGQIRNWIRKGVGSYKAA